MDAIFVKILNMSIVASWLIIAIIILRFVLQNSPKWIRCVMWLMVAIRLIIPFSFESNLSLVPNAQSLDSTSYSSTSYIDSDVVDNAVGEVIADINKSAEAPTDILSIISLVWVIGVALMLGYMLLSYVRIYVKVRERVKLKDNIWLCDHIESPFVLGVFKPQIYLHSSMNDIESEYVIAHEQAHLKRFDNIWKPFGFVLLSIYWFNPLCWIAYWLFNKDIELACDEKVVRTLSKKEKKIYSTALLSCSINRHTVAAYPLAFGEVDVKHRIKNVLNYEKPAFYVVVIAFAFCTVIAVSFMTDPLSASATSAVIENIENSSSEQSMLVDLSNFDINKTDIHIVHSIVSDKIEEENPKYITKIELDEEQKEIRVHVKNLDGEKESWFRENICDSPYIVFVSVIEETKPTEPATKPTEPVTEEDEETEPEYTSEDDYYDDSYYYEERYSGGSDSALNLVEIEPFNESENAQKIIDYYSHIYDGYSDYDVLLDSVSGYSQNQGKRPNDFVVQWDYSSGLSDSVGCEPAWVI